MKITRMDVDGFGVWSGLSLDDLSPGLNVFYGPNEAGKTTLMQFVRAMFYGFSPARRRYLPPVHGGRPGGTMLISCPQGQYQIARHDNPADTSGEQLLVVGPDGSRHGEPAIRTLLSNIDETIYGNVFAVGLRELQELATLNATEAASQLYGLSIGLDRVSLVEVMRELETSRNHILDRGGGPSQVLQLTAQRDKLRRELDDLGQGNQRYARVVAEREQIDREVQRLEAEQRQLEQETRLLDIAIAQRKRWRERTSLDDQLTALGDLEAMPDGAIARLDTLNQRLAEHQRQGAEVKRQRAAIRDEVKRLALNEALWQQAPRVESLLEQEAWVGTLQKRIGELEKEISQLESQITAEQQRFGLGQRRDGRGGNDAFRTLNSRSLAALREPAVAVRRFQKKLERAQQEMTQGRENDQTLASKIETALSSRGERNLAEAMDRTGSTVTLLRRRAQIGERIEQMEACQEDLDAQVRRLHRRQLMPVWNVMGLAGVFILGMMMAASAMLMPGSITGALNWLLGILGLAAMAGPVATFYFVGRINARNLEASQRQQSMLKVQLKQARQERDHLDQQIPPDSASLASRLQAAEAELASLEELVPMDAQRRSTRQDADALSAQVRQAEQGLKDAQRRWREGLAKLGLPDNLTSKQIRQLMTRCDEIGEIRRRLELRYEECQQRNHELEALSTRVSQMVAETRVTLAAGSTDVAEQIRELGRQLEEQQSRRKRRQVLRVQARQLKKRLAKIREAAVQFKRRRAGLLRECQAPNEAEFRRRAASHAQRDELLGLRQMVQREIDAAIAGQCSLDTLREYLEGPTSQILENRLEQMRTRLQTTRTHLQQRFELRGRLAEQVKTLSDDRQLASRQMALDCLEKRIQDLLGRWRTLAVAGQLLESVRKTYEKERQPETLQEASGYLDRMTEGRYPRVWTPLSENVLLVDDASGKALGVEMLSQGTREQLFVCLRMALASSYARRGATLPMVLDDVLVNFDTHRAASAAGVLRDFAAMGHQMLVFTCHEHIFELFRSLDVHVNRLPARGEQSSLTAAAKPAVKKPKRKSRPEPEPEIEPELEAAAVQEEEPRELPFVVEEIAPAPAAPIAMTPIALPALPRAIPQPALELDPPPVELPRAKAEPRRRRPVPPKPRPVVPPVPEVRQPEPPPLPLPSRPVRAAARDEASRRRGLVPWEAPWGEEKAKSQPSVFINERNERQFVESDAEPHDYASEERRERVIKPKEISSMPVAEAIHSDDLLEVYEAAQFEDEFDDEEEEEEEDDFDQDFAATDQLAEWDDAEAA